MLYASQLRMPSVLSFSGPWSTQLESWGKPGSSRQQCTALSGAVLIGRSDMRSVCAILPVWRTAPSGLLCRAAVIQQKAPGHLPLCYHDGRQSLWHAVCPFPSTTHTNSGHESSLPASKQARPCSCKCAGNHHTAVLRRAEVCGLCICTHPAVPPCSPLLLSGCVPGPVWSAQSSSWRTQWLRRSHAHAAAPQGHQSPGHLGSSTAAWTPMAVPGSECSGRVPHGTGPQCCCVV